MRGDRAWDGWIDLSWRGEGSPSSYILAGLDTARHKRLSDSRGWPIKAVRRELRCYSALTYQPNQESKEDKLIDKRASLIHACSLPPDPGPLVRGSLHWTLEAPLVPTGLVSIPQPAWCLPRRNWVVSVPPLSMLLQESQDLHHPLAA